MSKPHPPITSRRELEDRLSKARTAGVWMPWATSALALTWWGGTAAYLYGKFGFEPLQALSPAELGGCIAMAAGPGLALIMSGFMAREATRSARANELVLAASEELLSPAEAFSNQITTLGQVLAKTSGEIHDTLNETEARVQVIRQDMHESSDAAIKAAEVVRADSDALKMKLAQERDELSRLSESIKQQASNLADSIPMQAEKMVRAATMAQKEVQRAGQQLDQRLNDIERTGKALSSNASNLDQMTAESRKRAQQLVQALMSINENLLGSSRTVDNAIKAGDLAVEASKTTADAIRAAMDAAFDNARKSSDQISSQSAKTNREAEDAMKRLIETASRAEGLVKQAMAAANEQADQAEQRMDRLSDHMYEAANRATHAAEAGLERARARIERASRLLNDEIEHPTLPENEPQTSLSPPKVHKPTEVPKVTRPVYPPQDLSPFDPLEEVEMDSDSQTPDFYQGKSKPTASSVPETPTAAAAEAAGVAAEPAIAPKSTQQSRDKQQSDMTWSDLLSKIGTEGDEEAHHQTALAFVEQLNRSGIRLKRAIRSSDLRRIAAATARGDRQRRRATKQAAPGELTQIERLLTQDEDLRIAAESYLALEQDEALKFLGKAERAREDAGPRLAAYLLLDAALTK